MFDDLIEKIFAGSKSFIRRQILKCHAYKKNTKKSNFLQVKSCQP